MTPAPLPPLCPWQRPDSSHHKFHNQAGTGQRQEPDTP